MNLDYPTIEYGLSVTLLSCAMFGMGATLTVDNFKNVLRSPRGLLLVLGMQTLVMPVLALVLSRVFSLPSGVAIGLILVAALPGGLFSNLITYFGKGNVALSVSSTAVCTILSLLTTVFVLQTFALSELPEGFSMPVSRILSEVVFCMFLPLGLGMLLKRMLPKQAPKIANLCMRISIVLLVLMVGAAMSAGRLDATAYGWTTPVLILLFALCGIWTTYGLGKLLRLSVDDSFTVAIEVLVRNTHLGILLKAALFPASDEASLELGDGVLYTLLMYAGVCLFCSATEIYAKRRGLGPIFGRKAAGDSNVEETKTES